MKNLLKKGFCALLCIALIACGIVPAFAADTTPVVLVPGVMNTPIYDDATGNQVLMPDFKRQLDIEGTVNALKDVLHLQDTGAYDKAIDELIAVAKGLFDEARCDENGNPMIPSHHVKTNGSIAADTASAHYSDESAIARQVAKTIGNRNVYIFTYDWRLDIVGIATACGYPTAVSVDSFEMLDKYLADAKVSHQLCLIEVKCAIGARENLGRPTTTARENNI